MALSNPTRLITVSSLSHFENKLADKYQGKSISVDGLTATTVEGAFAELASSIPDTSAYATQQVCMDIIDELS